MSVQLKFTGGTARNLDPAVGAAQTCDNPQSGDKHLALQDWRPVEVGFATFMINCVTCPACRIAKSAGAATAATRLHVHRQGPILTITEADDLHDPGRCIQAEHAMDSPLRSIYRLSSKPLTVVAPARFCPAFGFVTLSGPQGRMGMNAVGVAHDFCDHRNQIFTAREV